jgi:tryptophan synthase alpha chain
MRLQGIAAIQAMFERAEQEGRAAFLPYYPVGFPTWQDSLDAFAGMARAGVDGFEIGVPFSDPLADGPVIQEATQIALQNGITVRRCLEAVRLLREQGIDQPMMLMSYANPLIAYGVDRFIRDALAAGVDGLIIPDLPLEESAYFSDACRTAGIALIFFLAPTSNAERIALAASNATGFIYVVSLTGITGARSSLPDDLSGLIERIRAQTSTPLVLGFGISTPEHARRMHGLVNGFIVGSALVRAGKQSADQVIELAASLRQALP